MLDTIPVPAQSKFGAAVARRLNASRPIAPAGTLAMSGPTGTGFAPLPANLRDRRATSDLHPWKVFARTEKTDGETGEETQPIELFVPTGSLFFGQTEILPDEITGLTEKGDDIYQLDDIDTIDETPVIIWLRASKDEEDDESTVVFDIKIGNDPTDDIEGTGVKPVGIVPIALVHITEDESTDKRTGHVDLQYQHCAIFLAKGLSEEEREKFVYFADERSISKAGQVSTDPTQFFFTNHFHIYGFGKFTVPQYMQPIGTYTPPSTLTIDPTSDDTTNVAFLVREGNSENPDSNFIGYRKLKIGGSSVSSPFNYEKTTTTDPSTHQPVTTHKLVNCKFYWDGVLKSLNDFDVSGVLGGGSVYLVGTQAAPSASSPDPEWTWQLATLAGQATSGGKVLNYKLWDFSGGKPSVDYRTTFLSLEDTTQRAHYVFKTPNGDEEVEVDTTGSSPKVVIRGSSGKTVTLDTADIIGSCDGDEELKFHTLKFKDADGNTKTYHGLFCKDIDLTGLSSAPKVSSTKNRVVVDVMYDTNDHYLKKKMGTLQVNPTTGELEIEPDSVFTAMVGGRTTEHNYPAQS